MYHHDYNRMEVLLVQYNDVEVYCDRPSVLPAPLVNRPRGAADKKDETISGFQTLLSNNNNNVLVFQMNSRSAGEIIYIPE